MKRKTRKKKNGEREEEGKDIYPTSLEKTIRGGGKASQRKWKDLALFTEEESFFLERENDS